MKASLIILFSLLFPGLLFSQYSNELESYSDTLSYAFGVETAKQMKDGAQVNIDELDVNAFMKGFESTYTADKLLLGEKQIKDILTSYFKIKAENIKRLGSAESESFLQENKLRPEVITTASGLQYEILQHGDGIIPGPDSKVIVHYTGYKLDGTKFDSSYDRGEPATFGVKQVIKGWTEALQMMKVGDKWKLYVPSNLAYGEKGAGGVIEPFATLIFEVELLGIE